jgi:hypothetical protein
VSLRKEEAKRSRREVAYLAITALAHTLGQHDLTIVHLLD